MGNRGRIARAVVLSALGACKAYNADEPPTPSGSDSGIDGSVPPATEDCFDGRDDDGNSRRDCEEPSCAPYAHCAPSQAELVGWTAYFTFVAGGDCPADISVPSGEVWAASSEPASCPACTCMAAIDCTGSIGVAESAYAGCNPIKPFSLTIGQCGTIAPLASGTAQFWQLGDFQKGTCTASNEPPVRSAKYTRVRLCTGARLGEGCVPGEVCAPGASGSTGAPLCVSRTHAGGAPLPCPTGFPIARLLAAVDRDPESAFDDKRTCDACSCTGPTGASCNGVLTLASDGMCGTVKGQVTGASCTNVSCGGSCGSGRVDVTPNAGTCLSGGGGPLGRIELVGAGQQLCCDR